MRDITMFIEYQLSVLKKWSYEYDNKRKKGIFENVYYNLKVMIMDSKELSEQKKVVYLNQLKDIKKTY